MDFNSVIRAAADPPGINHELWIALIRDHPDLVPPEPRQAINPFTKARTTIQPRPDVARVVVDGQEIGRMSWAEGEANEINVFGDRRSMAQLAHEIAGLLDGGFEAESV